MYQRHGEDGLRAITIMPNSMYKTDMAEAVGWIVELTGATHPVGFDTSGEYGLPEAYEGWSQSGVIQSLGYVVLDPEQRVVSAGYGDGAMERDVLDALHMAGAIAESESTGDAARFSRAATWPANGSVGRTDAPTYCAPN